MAMNQGASELSEETAYEVDEETLRAARSTRPGAWKERERAQRELLIGAMAKAVATKGYAAVSVTDVLVLSRLSRMTFYKHFEGKEECFLAAFKDISERVIGVVEGALAGEDSATVRARAALGEVTALFAARPELAYLCLVESRAVGKPGVQRYQGAVERIVGTIGGEGGADGLASLALGGLTTVIGQAVRTGSADALGGLAPELLFVALTPCIGPEAAEEESRRWGEERGRISAVGGGAEADMGLEWAVRGGPSPTPPKPASAQEAIDRLVEVARVSAAEEADLAGQVEAALRAILVALATNPELAEAALAEGEQEGRDHWPYREALEGFAPPLERAVAEAGLGIEQPATAARAVVAGLTAVILREVDEGRGEDLSALAPELVQLALNPFRGA